MRPDTQSFISNLSRSNQRGPDAVRGFFAPGAVHIGRAPGRLDVMGGIADYSGSLVLEMPLGCATHCAAQSAADGRLCIRSKADANDHWLRFDTSLADLKNGPLADAAALREHFQQGENHWVGYVVGVVHWCLRHGAILDGLRLRFESDVPLGKGVSSSASFEVAAMRTLAHLTALDLAGPQLAKACQWVENHVVGAPCGLMDQMTSACGREDRLLRLFCQPDRIEGHVTIPRNYTVFGIDSGIRHAVSGADYGTVRCAAFMGLRMLTAMAQESNAPSPMQRDPWRGYLANVGTQRWRTEFAERVPAQMSGKDFLARFTGTTDTVTRVQPDKRYPVRQATAHPIEEHQRVIRFAELLESLQDRADQAIEMGELMYGSHDSYSACGLGSDGTDALVKAVREMGPSRGLFGAKITGGGSGGTVAIFAQRKAEPAITEIAKRYEEQSGRTATIITGSGPGAFECPVREAHVD